MMSNEMYEKIKYWLLEGDITEDEKRELLNAIYTGKDVLIYNVLDIMSWNHLGQI